MAFSTTDFTGGIPMGHVLEAAIMPFRWIYILTVGYYLPRVVKIEQLNKQGFDFSLFDEVYFV